ncbi:trypsin-like peptidase domain-containing protein [Candidatus Palauibacter sp.]|uniref:trypsin-like peptidase domain-containing protein n=1 Tax=Candidatus Palauibacter sp. TaxID=3101350 RepID=UPI003AF276E7
MSDSLRTRLNLLIATTIAFAFGLGLASALDLTPFSIAADGDTDPGWVIGAPGAAAPTMENGFADVADRVAPAVVTLYVSGERGMPSFSPFPFPPDLEPGPGDEEDPPTRMEAWSGSGFIVSEDGYVVTNNHVVADAERIDLQLHDGRRFNDVELVGRDPQTDVALLRLDADELAVLPIGSSDATEVGEWVLAIGSPGFRSSPGPLHSSVTAGIVSAKGRNIDILGRLRGNPFAIEDFIQTDAVINRGNSGGPLVNAAGEVIGINTAILSTTGSYQGYGFAVPIELAREVVDDLIEFGEVRRALIGVAITDVTAADAEFYGLDRVEGALIQSFSSGDSPARDAGLEVGDVIVAAAGEPISGVSELQRRIRAFEPGETVNLEIVRRSTVQREVASVTLIPAEVDSPPRLAAQAEPTESGDALGLEVRDYDELSRADLRRYEGDEDVEGVIIVGGDPRGAVGRQFGRIPVGATIIDINGAEVRGRTDYDRIVAGLRPGDAVSLRYLRDFDQQSQIRSVLIPER